MEHFGPTLHKLGGEGGCQMTGAQHSGQTLIKLACTLPFYHLNKSTAQTHSTKERHANPDAIWNNNNTKIRQQAGILVVMPSMANICAH